jgi:hypothetical protein
MKKIILSIPKPCHENWNEMTTVEKGKFCGACQKTVIDFTEMNDRQIAEFFRRPSASVCGRFHDDQLDRNIAIPRKRVPWIKYFFQFSLPAFLVSMKAGAQGKMPPGREITCSNAVVGKPAAPEKALQDSISKKIRGKVIDLEGNPVPYASVMIKGTNTGVQCNASGDFELNMQADADRSILVSALGFEAKEIKLSPASPEILIALKGTATLGEIVSVGLIINRPVERKPIPSIKKILDTAFTRFSVYPNPVKRHSNIKIDLKKIKAGDYTISLVNVTGEVVQTEEVTVENKRELVDFSVNQQIAGTYFVKVFNRKTGASYSEKIIIR